MPSSEEKTRFGVSSPATSTASTAPEPAEALQDVPGPASTAPGPAEGSITPRTTKIPATPPELLSSEKNTENKDDDEEDAGLSSKTYHCKTIAGLLLPKARIQLDEDEDLTRHVFGSPIPTQNINNNDEQDEELAKDKGQEQQQVQEESDLLQEIGLPA